MRRRWLALVVLAGVVAAVAGTVLAVAINVATGGTARWFPTMERFALWWTVGGTAAMAGAGLVAGWARKRYDQAQAELIPVVQPVEPWVVDRPEEVNQIVTALLRKGGGTVGITTALNGAGGFGKTTIARMVCSDPRVARLFGGRVYWVTVGRDAGKQALAGMLNGLLARLQPDRPATFTDAGQAGEHLAAVLADGPPRLLVLDDVWSEDQLAGFGVAGKCARLVTTRIPSLIPGGGLLVRVDQMSEEQAVALLQAGLPPLPPGITTALVAETGRWALLLRMVSKILADQVKLDPDISTAAAKLLAVLRQEGKLQVDKLARISGRPVNIEDPAQRARTVSATIQASTGMLSPVERDRLTELAVFAEDETIPVPLIAMLWQATGALNELAARALCARLADLALLTVTPDADAGAVTMHDVIRDYLREQTSDDQLVQIHQILLDATANTLPTADAVARAGTVTAWWELPERARYLREHLIEHLLAAGRAEEAEAVVCDLRWAGERLRRSGVAAPVVDLSRLGTPGAARRRAVLERVAHMLAPTDPVTAVVDILHCRLAADEFWEPQAIALRDAFPWPRLVNRLVPPDLAPPRPAPCHMR